MRYFEDFKVGDSLLFTDRYLFTEEEIIEVGQRWDPQPFHIDKEAAKESIFGGLVAASTHLFAAYCRIGIKEYPTAAVSALGFNNVKTLLPVRPGDVLRKTEVVLESRLSNSKPGCGILRMRADLHNQNDELVFSAETAFIVRCKSE